MKLLLCGLMYDENCTQELKAKIKDNLDLPVAANVFQRNLVYGIKENEIQDFSAVNSLPVGTWPKHYADIYWGEDTSIINDIECKGTKTVNVVGLKQYFRMRSAYKLLKRYIKENPNAVILTYNFYLPYYSALCKLKKKKKLSFHLCTLVTDLPNEFGIVTEKGIRKLLAAHIGKKTMKMTQCADSFVLLTEEMKYPLKVNDRPYVVVEGFAKEENAAAQEGASEVKTVVYTGTMNRLFGVGNLVKAFQMIEREDVELHLYGIGDMADEILALSKKDKRIKYFGSVSREVVLQAQKHATLLVNPRGNTEDFTKYSFPSKTMEYMASGRPLIAFLLDGMTREYAEYILTFQEFTPESMAESLKEALNLSVEELNARGERAKEFVLRNKNRKVQTKKILDMIEDVLADKNK